MRAILAVAHMTMLELRRSRVSWGVLVLLALAAFALLVGSVGAGHEAATGPDAIPGANGEVGVREPDRRAALFALIIGLVEAMLALLTLLTSAALVDDDIESGTMLVVAVRPISRSGIVLGKFLGIVSTQLVVVAGWGLVVGAIESLKAGDIVPFTPIFLTIMQSMPLLMLAAGVGLAMSVVCPARLAGLLATGVFIMAAILARASGSVFGMIEATVPSGKLAGLGIHGEIQLDFGMLVAGSLAVALWVGLAALLLESRSNLT